ncbi:MAG: hypothetical protein ACI80P_000029 [Flavobacteriales bacterium]|jgi:uncharacterized protein
MDIYKAYKIPFIGLKVGQHEFEFELGDTFFESFEHSEITGSEINVDLLLEKQSTMMVLDFEVYGTVETVCDRCGSKMRVDIDHEDRLIIKYGDQTGTSEDEILIYGTAIHMIELQQYLYEYAHLGLPSRHIHENESDCDQDALKLLNELREEKTEDEDIDPRWEGLKGLK